jgi:hypothetical protein
VDAEWAPDGQWLLVWDAVTNGTPAQRHLRLDRADGSEIRTYQADDGVWVDDRTFLIYRGTMATLGSVDSDAERVPSVALPESVVSGGHGAVAYSTGTRDASEEFSVWTGAAVTPTRPGEPKAWSAGGDELAVWHFAVAGHGTGGQPTGWLEVLSWPSLRQLAIVHGRGASWGPMRFDPTGRYLAFMAGPQSIRVLDVASGSVAAVHEQATSDSFVWNSAPQLVVPVEDGSLTTFSATGTTTGNQVRLGDSAVASLDGSTVLLYFSQEPSPITLVRSGSFMKLNVPGSVEPFPVVSPDGRQVVIITSSGGPMMASLATP